MLVDFSLSKGTSNLRESSLMITNHSFTHGMRIEFVNIGYQPSGRGESSEAYLAYRILP